MKLFQKSGFKTRAFRMGSYSVAAGVIVIAIAVVINVLLGILPTSVTQLDNSAEKLLTISDQTKQILADLDQDIDIYWIVQGGSEDGTVRTLLDRYSDLSAHVQVTKIDPDIYPTFAKTYEISTLYNNSLVVESAKRYRYVDYSDIYLYEFRYDPENMYDEGGSYSISFNGESAVTSAIDYVTSDKLPKLYSLTGHGESALAEAFSLDLRNDNIEYAELSLLTAGSVPEDADCLLVNTPTSDISEAERDQLLQYLKNGGKMLLITNPPAGERLTNLGAVMAEYSIRSVDGIVVEGNQNYCLYDEFYWVLPTLNSHPITDALIRGSYHVTLPVSQGLEISEDLRDGLEITPLLTTSDSAFSKLAGYDLSTYDKEDGDIAGPFCLAAAVSEAQTDGSETQIVWIGSSSVTDVTANSYVSGANEDFFLNALGWMCKSDESPLSIRAKNLDVNYLTMNNTASTLLTVLVVGIIPAVYLAVGIVIFVRRKRK